jgi:hypothetical protein
MGVDSGLLALLTGLLGTLDDQEEIGPRLAADAQRLWRRLQSFLAMGLLTTRVDESSLELACYALQLPIGKGQNLGKLRQRCEQAAELMVGLLSDQMEEHVLDRVSRLLLETPLRKPRLDEARLLADAANLDDFGITGFVVQAAQFGLLGQGVAEISLAWDKREQYGYWEARLKDGFHFEPVGRIARRRLEQARQIISMLNAELTEDRSR